MRTSCLLRAWARASALMLAATTLAVACGKDDPGGSGDGSGTDASSTGAESSTSSSTTVVAEGSSSEGGSGSADSSSGGPAEVTIIGELRDLPLYAPIEGAAVSVLDMPGFETTTDAMGMCMIGPFLDGTELFVEIAPSTDYYGSVLPITVEVGEEEQDLAQISYMTVQSQIDILVDMMPAEPDLMQSIVIVRLLQSSLPMQSGAGVVVDMDPAPAPGTFYSPDANGYPVLDKNIIEYGLIPVIVYYNVPESAAGEITITPTHESTTCSVVHPSFPTLPEHMTLVDVTCS